MENSVFQVAGAKWIAYPCEEQNPQMPAPRFRKKFWLDKEIAQATLYVCGLGVCNCMVNGVNLNEELVFATEVSDYSKRVYYVNYDLTKLLTQGENTLQAELGRGQYSMITPNPWRLDNASWTDRPKLILCLQITYSDNTTQYVVTDEQWEVTTSPTVYDCFYCGEDYDARLEAEIESRQWLHAALIAPPAGELCPQNNDPIRIINKLRPTNFYRLGEKSYVYCFQPYVTGWIELRIRGNAGDQVTIQYAEVVDEQGRPYLNQSVTPDRMQLDRYTCGYEKEAVWHPSFSYKGFYYVLVEGLEDLTAEDAVACMLCNDLQKTGDFHCDNELVNWIHDAFRHTFLCNAHSIPTDTPVFEKLGWTGDGILVAPSSIKQFDMRRFYSKWLTDFQDSQKDYGEIPVIIPSGYWSYEDNVQYRWNCVCGPAPVWDMCYVELPWLYYMHYGDIAILEKHYGGLKRYIQYVDRYFNGALATGGLGDWLSPTGDTKVELAEAPEKHSITSAACHCRMLTLMQKIAEALNLHEDANLYAQQFAELKKEFNARYFREEKGYYQSDEFNTRHCKEMGLDQGTETWVQAYPFYTQYRQSSNVLALAFGLVEPQNVQTVLQHLVEDIHEKNDHLNTGLVGTRYLFDVLADHGYQELAWQIINADGYPGWKFVKDGGFTTLVEAWEYEVTRSHCHYWSGSITNWFYERLGGITALAPGYEQVQIQPFTPEDMNHATCRIVTAYGPLTVAWKREEQVQYSLEIPQGVTAFFHKDGEVIKLCGGTYQF